MTDQEAISGPVTRSPRDRATLSTGREGHSARKCDICVHRVRRRRIQSALDGDNVIALAQQQVHGLDRTDAAIGAKATGAEGDPAVADATGVDQGFTEGHTGDQAKVEIVGHAQATQRGLGHHSRGIGLAGVVVDIEYIDLLALRRLGPDAQENGIGLAR